MKIDIASFIFGIILTFACVIIFEKVWGRFWGPKRLRELEREVRRLQNVIVKKDELVRKSLLEMKDREEKNEKSNPKN